MLLLAFLVLVWFIGDIMKVNFYPLGWLTTLPILSYFSKRPDPVALQQQQQQQLQQLQQQHKQKQEEEESGMLFGKVCLIDVLVE
jgi:hypothetical protein